MKKRHRVRAALTFVAISLSAACTQLFIGDLRIDDHPDGSGGTDANADAVANADASPSADADATAAVDAGPLCEAGVCQSCDGTGTCTIVFEQSGGALYPVWPVLSTTDPEFDPIYLPADGGAIYETHTQLLWRVSTSDELDAGLLSIAQAQGYCASIGAGYRLPTRVELATTTARQAIDAAPPSAQVVCVPPQFDPSDLSSAVWSSSHVYQGVSDAAPSTFNMSQTSCGFNTNDETTKLAVRCVKGAPGPATFEVTANLVWAKETGLEWEREGKTFSSVSAAKSYCTSLPSGAGGAWHLPKIEELYGIIDPRFSQVFHPLLFPHPLGPTDAQAPTKLVSSTVFLWISPTDPDYDCVDLKQGGIETGTEDNDAGGPILLARCVHSR